MPSASKPSHKALTNKLRLAKAALEAGSTAILAGPHFVANMIELGSEDAKEHWKTILVFINEILASGGGGCWKGPIKNCTHPPFNGEPLYDFVWHSPSVGKMMYLKFGIRSPGGKPKYLYLNCHNDQPEKVVRY
jgi:hypothetical protein